MLTCRKLTEIVTDYLEGRLALLERMRCQCHIGMCRRCRAYLRQMSLTIMALGRIPAEPVSVAVRDELVRRFSGWYLKGV